ncbi:MAG: hypothetical protein Q7K44_03095 [Candidatus Liptonbacteria bacterium]|nr:hypothetical protein [Candidatus Liptonbacteria bacterium]
MNVSLEQRFALLTKIGANLDWDSLTSDQVQVGVSKAHAFAAKEFETLVRNGFRIQTEDFFQETGEITIKIPALARPTLKQLREDYPWRHWKKIEYDVSTEKAIELKLGTVFRLGDVVSGPEYEKRISPHLNACLGSQQALWLRRHIDEFPELKPLLGKIYIDFPGVVMVSISGKREMPYLAMDDESYEQWCLSWGEIDNNFHLQRGRIAIGESTTKYLVPARAADRVSS